MTVLTVCNSAYRSSMGAAILLKMGFKTVLNMEGGSEAWIAAGLPTLSNTGGGLDAAGPAMHSVKLPERLPAAELNRMMMDLPGVFEIVDVRPPAHFADFRLPGSQNAAIADVIANPAYLHDAIPLVIVDRDGSLAMAVGGILCQKSPRPIKVLFGGMEAYWSESDAPRTPASVSPTAAPAVKPAVPVPSPAKPAASTPAPVTPKKKSAGC